MTADNIAQLPAIERAADQRFFARGFASLPPPAPVDAYAGAVFVLVAGTPPIGFVRVIELDGQAHLEQISVVPDRARRGIGGRLLTASIAAAQELGKTRLTLITFADVPWIEPFYAKYGFVRLPRLTKGLKSLRRRERALGLDRLGERVAMSVDLCSSVRYGTRST